MSDLLTLGLLNDFREKIEKVSKLPGPQGERGERGPAGKDGKDGKPGKDGKDGKAGVNGKDGQDGKDGEDGLAGIGVANAHISFDNHLVLEMTDGNEIDAGEIRVEADGDVTINKYVSGGGGGFSGNYLDMDGKGIIARFTAGDTLVAGDVCRLDSSGQMAKADALAEPLCNNLMALALDDLADGTVGRFLLSGYHDVEGYNSGDILYVALGGGVTEVRPASSGSIVRVLGYAISPTQIFFDPDKTWIEVN